MSIKVYGENPAERVLWMCLWAPGPNGRRGLPLVLVGDPGKVKSSLAREMAQLGGLPFRTVLASVRQPTDFLGMPITEQVKLDALQAARLGRPDVLVTRYAAPGWAVDAALEGRGVVCLDEVNTSPPAVQAALLRVTFEGVVGEFELPPDVRLVLAMNETADAAGGWDVALPLANRLGWLPWQGPELPAWSSYMLGGGGLRVGGQQRRVVQAAVNPADLEAEVDRLHARAWGQAVGAVTGFLHSKPSVVHVKPAQAGGTDRAWPSMRTWDFATCALAGCHVFELGSDEQRLAVDAYVGAGAGNELRTWVRNQDLPDPEAVARGAAAFQHDPARLDRSAAVLRGAVAWFIAAGQQLKADEQKAVATNLWGILGALPDSALDLALPVAVQLHKTGHVAGLKTAYKALARLQPLMEAVGIGR